MWHPDCPGQCQTSSYKTYKRGIAAAPSLISNLSMQFPPILRGEEETPHGYHSTRVRSPLAATGNIQSGFGTVGGFVWMQCSQ
eukprot:9480158-Pyramimonas_sp.AAC.3